MSWMRWLSPLIMSTAILNSGHSIAEQANKEKQSGCFLKNAVFNNIVDEEYNAPIRFGFMEANSAKKESVYFGMKGSDFYFGFGLSLNITDPDNSRRLAYEIKNSVPNIGGSLPDYELIRKSTGVFAACDQEQFVIILPQSGNEFSFSPKEWVVALPHDPGLMIEGRLVSSHATNVSFGQSDRKLRVNFSSFADRVMEKKLSKLEEQPEVPVIVVEMEESIKASHPEFDSNSSSYQLTQFQSENQMLSSSDNKKYIQSMKLNKAREKIDMVRDKLQELIKQVDDVFL
ncbi:hypothetical protein [Endozoicomonas elysicola]|nr:hypothetical protein [Endozoicomonas elysicola]